MTCKMQVVKLLTFCLFAAAAMYGQDARQITLVQEREAREQRLNARIEFELSHPYYPAPAVVVPNPKPAQLNAEEREALRKAMDRVAPCLTGKLVKDALSPLYVPQVDERCLAKR
jgi:hypothetical protein